MRSSLDNFISEEKLFFNALDTGIAWEAEKWDVSDWLMHRGKDKFLNFDSYSRMTKTNFSNYPLPKKSPLPYPFSDFVKSLIVYLNRTKEIGFASSKAYLNDCRRLHIIMAFRNENCVTVITRWHFEEALSFLKQINYKNLFDAAANLQAISNIIDSKKLTKNEISFIHSIKSKNRYYNYTSIKKIEISERIGNDKLPSYEALVAYAQCTNNPLNDSEEILLRTLDLLMAMGLRGNEVTHIPVDCWVETNVLDQNQEIVRDMHGSPLKNVGIRYYAEKKFQPRIHWLAKQDIPFAKRAVARLKKLTNDYRNLAKWQEKHSDRLWKLKRNKLITDSELLKFLGFNRVTYLNGYLKRNGIKHVKLGKIYREARSGFESGKYLPCRIYRAGEIEDFLLTKRQNHHDVLKQNIEGKDKIILRTSDLLSIRPEGAFRFKRQENTFYIFPGRIHLEELNEALGANKDIESIFERRSLTEADGSKIKLTSHQPRHWRNTLYELAGMSNVQQALAMGRQDLAQNVHYQHTSIKEKTKLHQDFLSFDSNNDKMNFLRDGIRKSTIIGEITDTYHSLKKKEGLEYAEDFLVTHGLAIHITPFGGCTHDFSQSPCQKHLQCWNGCSHLHRTHAPGETNRLEQQLKKSLKTLKKMQVESDDEFGKNAWVNVSTPPTAS
ncbi:hypothetical protein LB465_17850 [Salegentibacter sp. LM13S]|uniref:hypothetical protein n=1 Tax=Salegentibacter lacus TaxID=2873599 RepID=UPI001CD0371D|nr:hypothetical protein [Salegentibacter lacus]MBZ9632646.1 hypothetical protein [Salegentibacter lacus]